MSEGSRALVRTGRRWTSVPQWCRDVAAIGLIAAIAFGSGCQTVVVTGGNSQLASRSAWDGWRITGEVENKADARVGCVFVEFTLNSMQGRALRTVSTTKSDGIAPRETWSFAIDDANAAGATEMRLHRLRPC